MRGRRGSAHGRWIHTYVHSMFGFGIAEAVFIGTNFLTADQREPIIFLRNCPCMNLHPSGCRFFFSPRWLYHILARSRVLYRRCLGLLAVFSL